MIAFSDINDCKTDSCLNGGTCKDGINSFTCQCAEGFDGPTCENSMYICQYLSNARSYVAVFFCYFIKCFN